MTRQNDHPDDRRDEYINTQNHWNGIREDRERIPYRVDEQMRRDINEIDARSGPGETYVSGSKLPRDVKQPTAEEEFAKHSTRLIAKLKLSSSLPTYVRQRWIRKINRIDINQPSKGLVELGELCADYLRAVGEYKPRRDIFDLAITTTMNFEREMSDIKRELDWLKKILIRVEVNLRQNPFKKFGKMIGNQFGEIDQESQLKISEQLEKSNRKKESNKDELEPRKPDGALEWWRNLGGFTGLSDSRKK